MKRIILAAAAVLLFTQPAFAYSRLFYSVTVRVEAARSSTFMLSNPSPDLTLPADLPSDSNLPTEEIMEEEPAGVLDEVFVEEAGVENTQEEENIEPAEGSVSAIIGPPEGVELIQSSDLPPFTSPTTPLSTPPVEEIVVEEAVDETVVGQEFAVEEDLVEEDGVINTQEEEREEEPDVENTPEEENPAQEPEEKIQERTDESATQGEAQQ